MDHVGIGLGRVVVVVVRRAKWLVARMGRWGSSVGRRAEGETLRAKTLRSSWGEMWVLGGGQVVVWEEAGWGGEEELSRGCIGKG